MYGRWEDILLKVPLFHGFSMENLNTLLTCLRPRIKQYKKGQYVAIEGEKQEGIGIVITGNVTVSKENITGKRVIMDVLKPGDMFGEMAVFSDNGLWPASVFAHEDCTIMFLAAHAIVDNCSRICNNHRMLMLNMLKILTQKALILNRKVEYLSIKSMRGKISTYLLEQYKKKGSPMFTLPMNRDQLADFLNVSRPSMSREMCRMRDEGIIDFHRDSVRINDLDALVKAVESNI
ncbi:MAG: Crp/Fnr family transcriptional regulator [Clostridiaceae bacterium]|nr:Crp/Fnr family transcriptional regulator [Clostridiaceae bacterium]